MSYFPIKMGIDNGNVKTKSAHLEIGNKLLMSASQPELSKSSHTMLMGDMFYTALDSRMKYKKDKTLDLDTYHLTHLAMARELEYRIMECIIQPASIYYIRLGVGLPFNDMKQPGYTGRFQEYFQAPHTAVVEYNGNTYNMHILSCDVFPQGYAGMAPYRNWLIEEGDVVLIDIGGWTMELVPFIEANPVIENTVSKEYGSIHYSNRAIKALEDMYGAPAEQLDIERMVQHKKHHYPPEEVQLVFSEAEKYANECISVVHESGLELRRRMAAFIGGGSLLLKPFLSGNKMLGPHRFFENTSANAIGYERLLGAIYKNG